jgi:hypothetical protein
MLVFLVNTGFVLINWYSTENHQMTIGTSFYIKKKTVNSQKVFRNINITDIFQKIYFYQV